VPGAAASVDRWVCTLDAPRARIECPRVRLPVEHLDELPECGSRLASPVY